MGLNIDEINIGILAYVGDSVYEVKIRNYLILNLKLKVNEMQNISKKYVSAKSQSFIVDKLIEIDFLKEEELNLLLRARNYKPKSKPRYTNIKDYKKATGLEALFGMLYLSNNNKRIDELVSIITERIVIL